MSKEIYTIDRRNPISKFPSRAVIGNKGLNLLELAKHGINVPDGLIIPDSIYYDFLQNGVLPDWLKDEIHRQIAFISSCYTESFTDGSNQFLLSVRTSPFESMPGRLNTVLNVGMFVDRELSIEDEIKLSTLIDTLVAIFGLLQIDELSTVLALSAYEQLFYVIELIYRNWFYEIHENKLGLDFGIPIVIQKMIFTNLDPKSFSGVVFTSHPMTGKSSVCGEFVTQAQDELVSGRGTATDLDTLKQIDGSLYNKLVRLASRIKLIFGVDQDIEVCFDGEIHILQTRNLEISEPLAKSKEIVGRQLLSGIPSSPGVCCGRVIFNEEQYKQLGEGQKVILIQLEPNKFCLHNVKMLSGIVLAGGGMTSHVAILARKNGIPCIMGARNLLDDHILSQRIIKPFDKVTIDGGNGILYKDWVQLSAEVISSDNDSLFAADTRQLKETLTQKGIDPTFLDDDEIFLPKSIGISILEIYGLSVPNLFSINEALSSDIVSFSIRTSFLLGSSYEGFDRLGYNMPSRFNVSKKNLYNSVTTVQAEFVEAYGEPPDIIIHETHQIQMFGVFEVNRNSKKLIVETWNSYDDADAVIDSKIMEFGSKRIKLIDDLYIPEEVFDLPFHDYLIEWIVTKDGRLLFSDISVVLK